MSYFNVFLMKSVFLTIYVQNSVKEFLVIYTTSVLLRGYFPVVVVLGVSLYQLPWMVACKCDILSYASSLGCPG